MEIIIKQSQQDATQVAAKIIACLIAQKPNAVLGLATGSTPLGLYQQLIAMQLDWSGVTTFNLDEYVGIPREHSQSYHTFMSENLFQHINIRSENIHIPDGNAADIPESCAAYERQILAAGGIDLQVLGIGTDGHIGFNEPTSSLVSRTRIKTLTKRTREDNQRFFGKDEVVPYHAITMGIGTIMAARQNVLLAFGESKAAAIAEAVEGPVSANNPASILQMHQTVVFCLDEAAAQDLKRADYFRWVEQNKPVWQNY
jgi:glucosamine-6-phosphate deaminase